MQSQHSNAWSRRTSRGGDHLQNGKDLLAQVCVWPLVCLHQDLDVSQLAKVEVPLLFKSLHLYHVQEGHTIVDRRDVEGVAGLGVRGEGRNGGG
jgi:hypothetical protein